MVELGVESLIVTVCVVGYAPGVGLKVGVATIRMVYAADPVELWLYPLDVAMAMASNVCETATVTGEL